MGDISIIIPAYNAEKTLKRTLASLISNAEYIAEAVIVDDCSDDADYVEETANQFRGFFPIKTMRLPTNNGPGYARMEGFRAASGEWVTFVDSDDCLTASALRYVSEHFEEDVAVLHTMTIYYESGSFDKYDVEFSDGSCGGNYYRRKYILQHRLLPMIYPRLGEDEYFNDIISTYTDVIDKKFRREHYEYPAYEVHHDSADGLSFALQNWREYVVDSRLQGAMYMSDFYMGYSATTEYVKNSFLENFCFSQVMWQGLMSDTKDTLTDEEITACFDAFKTARDYYIQTFGGSVDNICEYYNEHNMFLFDGAFTSSGFQFDEFITIEDFFKLLDGEYIL